jgi:hypothetical protein
MAVEPVTKALYLGVLNAEVQTPSSNTHIHELSPPPNGIYSGLCDGDVIVKAIGKRVGRTDYQSVIDGLLDFHKLF